LKGDDRTSSFSGLDTLAVGRLVKVVSGYDNEYGYAGRVSAITACVARHLCGRTAASGSIRREIVGDPGTWGKNPRRHDRAAAASTTATVSSKD